MRLCVLSTGWCTGLYACLVGACTKLSMGRGSISLILVWSAELGDIVESCCSATLSLMVTFWGVGRLHGDLV